MKDEIPKRTTLPYARTDSGTNNQWYLVMRKHGEQRGKRFAFRTCWEMLEYYGFLLLALGGNGSESDAKEEIEAIRKSDEPFITSDVGDYQIELERLPF